MYSDREKDIGLGKMIIALITSSDVTLFIWGSYIGKLRRRDGEMGS